MRGLLGELGDEMTVFRNDRPERSDLRRLLAMTYGMTVGPPLRAPIDVLHYPLTVPVPRFAGPTVVTLHDLQHLELPSFFSRGERAFRRFAYEGAARRADVVVTPSEHAREQLVERVGMPADRIRAIPHGVDHDRFAPSGPMAGQGRFLIYPANLWPHKNHSRLLEALARAEDREIDLVLTGNDYGRRDEVYVLADRLGVRDRVRHLGFVEHDELPALLRGARGMIFPSLFEGFGQPPLEAMSCGCAVASSLHGALGEVCSGAVLELDPLDVDSIASAIDRLASEDRLVEELQAAGLERAAGFTWERSALAHVEAYALAGQPRGSSR